MNQENPIDELFRRKLGQAESPVGDDLWSRIAAARQPESRPATYRPYWLWGSLVLTSLLVLGLWLGLRSPESKVPIGSFPLVVTNTSSGQPAASLGESGVNNIPTLARTHDTEAVNTANVAQDIELRVSAPKVPSKRTNPRKSSVAGQRHNKNEVAHLPTLRAPHTAQEAVGVTPLPQIIKAEIPSPATLGSPVADEEEDNRIFGPHRRRQIEIVEALPTQRFEQVPEDLSRYLSIANRAPECAKFARSFLHFDLEVLGGVAYAHQQLKAKNSESLDHLNRRLSSESPRLSYGGGLRLSAISRTGLGFRMGLNYNQINERFSYLTGSSIDIRTNMGPNGEVLGYDTLFVGPQMANVRNQLRMVEVPLMLTYETQWKRLRLGFNVGAALNLWFDASGMLLSPVSDEPISFGQVGDRDVLPIFETQASAAVLGSISFAYHLHDRWSLVGEPYLRTHPRALSNQAYNLEQNYWQTGVQLGLRMRL